MGKEARKKGKTLEERKAFAQDRDRELAKRRKCQPSYRRNLSPKLVALFGATAALGASAHITVKPQVRPNTLKR